MMLRSLARFLLTLAVLMGATAPLLAAVCTPTPALPDTERRTEYTISASTGPLNVGFQLYGDSTDYSAWLEVWVNGTKLTGVTDFTVTSPTGPLANLCRPISDAQVTFTAAQTGTIEIVGARRPRRTSQVSENAGVTARAFNQVISDMEAQLRERWDWESRALRSPPGETLAVLPPAATRANKFLIFDSTGLIPQVATGAGSGNVVGPLTSTIGDIATWNNTTGSLLADTGFSFKNGRPWADVRAYGAVGDGVAGDTAAFQNAIAQANTLGGGIVNIPPGNYCVNNLVVTTPVRLIGAGINGTSLSACGLNVPVITLNVNKASIEHMTVAGLNSPTVTSTSNVVTLGASCVACRILHSQMQWGYYGIVANAADHFIEDVQVSATYGAAYIKTTAGGFHRRNKVDAPLPVSFAQGTTINARANTTPYALNAVVTSGGFYLQATVAGTSGGSPPTLQPYNTNITDGTVTWLLIAPVGQNGLQVDGGTFDLMSEQGDYSGFFAHGIAVVNTNAGAGPETIKITDATVGANVSDAIFASAGNDVRISGSQIANCYATGCKGISFATGWTGDAAIVDNVFFSLPFGVYINAGKNVNVTGGNSFFGGVAGAVGVHVSANINDFHVTGNIFGNSVAWGTTTTGIEIAAGTSNHYRIANNPCDGPTTCVSNLGTGTDQLVENGLGGTSGAISWIAPAGTVTFNSGSGSYAFDAIGTFSLYRALNSTFNGNGVQFGQLSTGTAVVANLDNQPIKFSTNTIDRWFIGATGGLYSNGVTGTDKGAGTLNLAGPIYIGGTQIACVNLLTPCLTGLGVGTTQIGSGANARILFDSSGILGEYTITGSGTTVAMATSPTFVTSIIDPLVIGGAAAGSALELRSTSATGSGDLVKITGGANGGTTIATFLGTGFTGYGTTTPQALLHLNSSAIGNLTPPTGTMLYLTGVDGAVGPVATLEAHGAGAPFITMRHAEGTAASPTQTLANDFLFILGGQGWTNAAAWTQNAAAFTAQASQNFTAAAQGTFASIYTTPTGANASAEAVRVFGSNGVAVGAFGTDPGAGGLLVNANLWHPTVANAAIATVLGSVGPTGSRTTVQEWFPIKNSAGAIRYVPGF